MAKLRDPHELTVSSTAGPTLPISVIMHGFPCPNTETLHDHRRRGARAREGVASPDQISPTLSGVSVATHRPRRGSRLLLVAEVTLLILAYFVVPITEGSLARRLLFYGLGIVLVIAITSRQVAREMAGADTSVRVDSLVIAIVLATLIFSLSYVAIDEAQPGEFTGITTRMDALYFSVMPAVSSPARS